MSLVPESQSHSIRCFQHCERVNIMCFSVPSVCPLCGRETASSESRIPPYILPTPFVSASDKPCSIVIKPTVGTFIRGYYSNADLHVGVTNSKGTVFDFDEHGLHIGSKSWLECVSLPVLDRDITLMWDTSLHSYSDPNYWIAERYQENHWNCFDFVFGFLKQIERHLKTGISCTNKKILCDRFIMPKTVQAEKYLSLYHSIERHGYFCQPA